ncbi:SulP family inorganic anion transporter [Ectothiorhodospiraceae bacterium WFHF3C12]|nr:SulP family inorganic anion transporter [Ectothiorhodospiraceae bacterium WFHF3C12]
MGPTARKHLPPLKWMHRVNRAGLRADLLAGLTGAIIVLPQGVAYAMIAGLEPQYGLYTAIVVPILAAMFGSSWHLVSGPTAAISVLVASVLGSAVAGEVDYLTAALTLTFLVGVIQTICGLARMGWLVNFISHTVVVGFTAGAAVVIAMSQIGNLLGLPQSAPGGLDAIGIVLRQPPGHIPAAVGLFALTVALCLGFRHLRPHWPALLLAMALASLAGVAIGAASMGVPMVGAIPPGLPPLSAPAFSAELMRTLVPGAVAVALLGLIEAVSVARAIATRSGQELDTDQEFIGQGVSNIGGSFLSAYAGSGSFTRSGANYEAGARTPLAAVFASIILVGIILLAPGLSAFLPIPVVAGVIVIIAWNLLDFTTIARVVRSSRQDSIVLGVTVAGAVLIDLEFAIIAGVVLSMLLYLRQTSHPRVVRVAPHPHRPNQGLRNADKHGLEEPSGLRALRVEGSLYFGAVPHVRRELTHHSRAQNRLLLDCSGVNFIDLAGAEMLAEVSGKLAAMGGGLYLCGLRDPAREFLVRSGYARDIGTERILGDPDEAVRRLNQRAPTVQSTLKDWSP